jgi:hypothetical protein
MDATTLSRISDAAKLRIHIVTSNVAFAVAAIENDPSPKFQLGTVVRMGLSDEEAADPDTISRMRWEYRAWVVGHALADISECIATFLNEIVGSDAGAFGYTGPYDRFERLGLDRKLEALPVLTLDGDYKAAIHSVTRARNCLIHRHGVVGERDCNDGGALVLTWRGIKLMKILPEGLVEFDPSHRGPATEKRGDMVELSVVGVEKRFPLGSRLDLEPVDLCTLSWCISGITAAIESVAAEVLGVRDKDAGPKPSAARTRNARA